jgi:hypothetical protein
MTDALSIEQLQFTHRLMLALRDIPDADLGKTQARAGAYDDAGFLPLLRRFTREQYAVYDGKAADLERTRRWCLKMQEAA